MSNPTQEAYERGFDEARRGFEPVVERLRSENSQLSKCVDGLMIQTLDLNKRNEQLASEYSTLCQEHATLKELYDEDTAYCELCGCVPHFCECDE